MDPKAYKNFLEKLGRPSHGEALRNFMKEKAQQTADAKKNRKPEDEKHYTPRGTLKEGAYLRAKDGDKLVHEDEIEGALEHARAEGDTDTAGKLERARRDIQTGVHGGKYYVGPSGKKVYVKDY